MRNSLDIFSFKFRLYKQNALIIRYQIQKSSLDFKK